MARIQIHPRDVRALRSGIAAPVWAAVPPAVAQAKQALSEAPASPANAGTGLLQADHSDLSWPGLSGHLLTGCSGPPLVAVPGRGQLGRPNPVRSPDLVYHGAAMLVHLGGRSGQATLRCLAPGLGRALEHEDPCGPAGSHYPRSARGPGPRMGSNEPCRDSDVRGGSSCKTGQAQSFLEPGRRLPPQASFDHGAWLHCGLPESMARFALVVVHSFATTVSYSP